MRRLQRALVAAAALAALAASSCDATVVELVTAADGDSDADSDSDSDADTDPQADSVEALILVPQWFEAVPARITAGFYEDGPFDGPPDFAGASYEDPDISTPGDQEPPYKLVTAQPPLAGEGHYYLVVTLFVEGGGDDVPVPGVDWVGATPTPLTLGPGTHTVDAGDVLLHEAP